MVLASVWSACEHMFVYHSFDLADYDAVKRLASVGLSDYAIASTLGLSRSTVQRWRRLEKPPFSSRPMARVDSRPDDNRQYAYLLGIYLGDGYISPSGRSASLQVVLDKIYPEIIEECSSALLSAFPRSAVARYDRPGAIRLQVCHPSTLTLFPQHGPGRKHDRPIQLVDWQRAITHEHPEALLRGLIHSDGCRSINRFRTKLPSGRVAEYAYPRYFFSNLSADIRAIFCEHCELLGIRWTQSNPRNISVSHRGSVAVLDAFVGPKE